MVPYRTPRLVVLILHLENRTHPMRILDTFTIDQVLVNPTHPGVCPDMIRFLATMLWLTVVIQANNDLACSADIYLGIAIGLLSL